MAHDVYLIGLFDDYMTYYMVDQAEWDKLSASRSSLGDMDWKPLVIKELLKTTFDLDQILQLVKDGKINVLGTAEGYQL